MEKTADATNSKSEATEVASCSSGNTSLAPVFLGSNSEIVIGMYPEFYRAALEGNIDTFKEKGKEVEFLLTPKKNTILHIHFTAYSASLPKKKRAYSARVSDIFVEEILRMCPALVMKANTKGETPLHIAARYGHSQVVSMLIESAKALRVGIENEVGEEKKLIRAINDNKDTALHEAVCFHHTQVVEILTKEDRDHSYFSNSAGETPLYLAAERAYLDVVLIILENCKSPNHDGPNGRTALHAAVILNDKEMVAKLLTSTSAKQTDENGWVPLHLAALYGSSNLIKLLLDFDRNTAYIRDKKGRTAFHLAVWRGHVGAVKKIIEHCPDCSELVEDKGKNAFHYAVSYDKPKAARRIMNNPSLSNLYNERDEDGNTPLHHLPEHVFRHSPLMKSHPRVDTMAFNKHNQTVIDIASTKKIFFKLWKTSKLKKIGARPGRRIVIRSEDDRKKEEQYGREQTRELHLIVATLIATVTFAAGFTMPGGTIQEGEHQGSPILKDNRAFQAFVITDCIALVLSASAVLIHVASTLNDMRQNQSRLFTYMTVGVHLTVYAMGSMIIAFVTGIYAVLGAHASTGIGIVTLLIGLPFVFTMFAIFRNRGKHFSGRRKIDVRVRNL